MAGGRTAIVEGRGAALVVKPADWMEFLPGGLDLFTTSDLANGMNARTELAQKMAYCLREGRMIELIGRRRRSNLIVTLTEVEIRLRLSLQCADRSCLDRGAKSTFEANIAAIA